MRRYTVSFIIFYITWYFLSKSTVNSTKCNQACHKTHPDKINIHIIPHTHDDVGWIKTVDQYFYGSNKGYTKDSVQYILDSVISELQKNPDRRYTNICIRRGGIFLAMVAFFWRWWQELNDFEKNLVTQLVEEGRLEFLHGGWCMSDEATPHYSSMIDQMTLGLKYLNDSFGQCGRPTAAWHIDPFGHSGEVAIEFAEMGFDGIFVGRIDLADHNARYEQKTLEMIWRPDTSLGEKGSLFTNVLYDGYFYPPGFCFDYAACIDDPIMDNKKLHHYNVDEKVAQFIQQMDNYNSAYVTNHVLVPMGQDFSFYAASSEFRNIDKLIKYVNAASDKYHVLYSTPSCYLKEINALNVTWPLKDNDDFFPYGSEPDAYWTGYYTSRPTLKYFVSRSNNILQATKQLATLLDNRQLENEEFMFKEAVALAQHHDAVSGTESSVAADDYSLYLHEGLQYGEQIIDRAFTQIYGADYPRNQTFCNLRNISQCSVSENAKNFVITIYNPLARNISVPVTFPIRASRNTIYRIYRQNGSLIEHDIVPVPKDVLLIAGRRSNATLDLTFIAENVPATGLANFYVRVNKSLVNRTYEFSATNNDTNEDAIIIDNGLIRLTFNKTDGLLRNIAKNGTTWPLRQNFFKYHSWSMYDGPGHVSGAYIFHPVEKDAPEMISSMAKVYFVYRGKNIYEVHQRFTPWLSQVVRLYKGSEDIEFEWLVESLPIEKNSSIELVTRYDTDIASNDTFYTDSNGRRWVERIRNYRKYWTLATANDPISINYYPLTTSMCIRDTTKQLTVITDRAEGGTSMKSGQLEIMLHRRLLYDDVEGLNEALNETAFGKPLSVRGKHIVQVNTLIAASAAHRFKVVQSTYQPLLTFSNITLGLNEWVASYDKNFSLLVNELPPNLHILTLERWRDNEILLRLEHIFQNNENPAYARPISINIKEIFAHIKVTDFKELTLAANREKDNYNRLKWNYEGEKITNDNRSVEDDVITLQPMEIRTFLLNTRLNGDSNTAQKARISSQLALIVTTIICLLSAF